MPANIRASTAAVAYARSMLELAEKRKKVDEIAQELRDLRQIVEQLPEFDALLSNPAVSENERGQLLDRTFRGKASELVMNFLRVLNIKGRLGLLAEISRAYDELLEQQRGIIEVDVLVAHKLSAEELELVRKKVGAALKKEAVVHQYVDESIIGGLIVRFEDKEIDASVRQQLHEMHEQLLRARPE